MTSLKFESTLDFAAMEGGIYVEDYLSRMIQVAPSSPAFVATAPISASARTSAAVWTCHPMIDHITRQQLLQNNTVRRKHPLYLLDIVG